MFFKHLAHMAYQSVHVHVGLVNIVEHVVSILHTIYQILGERHNITDIGHRLAVPAVAYHQELAAGDLVQQVVDVSPVTLAENHCGTHNIDVPVGMGFIPFSGHLFCLPFRLAIVIERIGRMGLVRTLFVESVDCH